MVGNFDRTASNAFRASITREISPPEATFSTGCGAMRPLAVNMKRMRSPPDGVNSPASVTSTSKCASGIPKAASVRTTLFDTSPDASARSACSFAASPAALLRSAEMDSR